MGMLLILSMSACAGGTSGQPPEGAYDCSINTPGSGDLASDIIGQWRFIQNASGQYHTFDANDTVIRTYTSDENDDVSYVTYSYEVQASAVVIGDDPMLGFEFSVDGRGVWSVSRDGVDQDWTRCAALR